MSITFAFYKGRRSENENARLFDIAVTHWPVTAGRFSHCELVSRGVAWSSSFRDGGVRQKSIDFTSGHWVLVEVPDIDDAPAIAWFERHRGEPYDWPGLFGFVLPWRTDVRGWRFCSESCAEALRRCLPSPSPAALRRAWRVSPNDLYRFVMSIPGAREIDQSYMGPGIPFPAV